MYCKLSILPHHVYLYSLWSDGTAVIFTVLQWFGSLESPFISLHFGGEMVTGIYQNVQTYTKIQNKCQKQSLYNSNEPESQYLI